MGMELLLAVGLGLFAFVEPCSIGIHLLLIGHLERLPTARRLRELTLLALTRAIVFGLIGVGGAFVGRELFTAQRGLWIVFGLLYIGLGALYLSGRQGAFLRALTPDTGRFDARSRSLGLGIAFGLYVPACAIPLLVALVGASAAGSASGAALVDGFVTLFVFGLALSAPLFGLVGTARGGRWLDRLVRLAGHLPRPTGALLALIGLVSIGLALWSDVPAGVTS